MSTLYRVERLLNSSSVAVRDVLSGEFCAPCFKDQAHAELFIAVLGDIPDPVSDMQVFQATDKFLAGWEEINLGVMPSAKELAAMFLTSDEYKALLPKEVPA